MCTSSHLVFFTLTTSSDAALSMKRGVSTNWNDGYLMHRHFNGAMDPGILLLTYSSEESKLDCPYGCCTFPNIKEHILEMWSIRHDKNPESQ